MTADAIWFTVYGTPAPQGSKRHVGGGRMVESSKKVGPWRDSVAHAARQAYQGPALDGPLSVTVAFRFPATSSWRKADKVRGWRWKDRTPDLDKLLRSTFDGMKSAGLIADDARIVKVEAEKYETDGWLGASVAVEQIDAADQAVTR